MAATKSAGGTGGSPHSSGEAAAGAGNAPPLEAVPAAGAASVSAYIRRTAEQTAHGVTWETLSYQDLPIRESGLWNGAAGVALFLAEHALATGDTASRELARQALTWALRTVRASPEAYDNSVGKGTAGIGLALLRLAPGPGSAAARQEGGAATATDETASWALSQAAALAAGIAGSAPVGQRGLLWGTAGEGFFLLRAAEATRAPVLLNAAAGRGAFLRDTALAGLLDALAAAARDSRTEGIPPIPLGLAPGAAGVGVFFAALLTATGDEAWAGPLRQIADAVLALARPDALAPEGLNWPLHTGSPELARCQWCTGAPGVGIFLAGAASALEEPRYQAAACAAGETAYAHGDARGNPSLCHGLAGTTELFLDLHQLTGDERWHARALDFAARAFAYRQPWTDGDTWPADEPGFNAVNLSTGAAGTGRVFLRLLTPGLLRSPLG